MKSFDIPEIYKSSIISTIKEKRRIKDKLKKDFLPTEIKINDLTIYLARHFGFCYGVENAVEIAYKALNENKGKSIYLLSEMIHNPEVNADLKSRGMRFIMDTAGNYLIDLNTLKASDIVIVPAFGTTIEIQKKIEELGINPYNYDTTCPFVEKVWNRAGQIGEKGFTVIVHGKPNHEETRATFSHAKVNAPTLIIKNLEEAKLLAKYIKGVLPNEGFFEDFKGRYSIGFNPDVHLEKIGVVNQTTMLAEETQEISNYLKGEIIETFKNELHFANTRDTLCYATNDNQSATRELLEKPADLAIIVGGYNSSNTGHLVELAMEKMPTYFVESEKNFSSTTVNAYNLKTKEVEEIKHNLNSKKPLRIALTCGASCPDSIMENVLLKIIELSNNKVDLNSVKSIVDKI